MQLVGIMAVQLKNIKRPVAFENVGDREMVDGVDKRSKDSAAMVPYWDKTDAIMGGVQTMRDSKDQYLPKFPKETKDDFDFRLEATKFTNIFRDIVEGLSAKPFEEPVSLVGDNVVQAFTDFADDVDGDGNNLSVFASATFFNGIAHAIDWILIDYPTVDLTKVKTKADQKAAGVRPFWSHVLGRNVLKAESKIINGEQILTLVRILEPGDPDMIREFTRSDDGLVTWQLYRKDTSGTSGKTEWIKDVGGSLTINVIPLVPFATGRRDGNGFNYFPAMQDAADLQIELYQQESALKFAKILTAYPMLSGNGVKPEKDEQGQPKPLSLGPAKVLYAPPDGNGNSGSWSYVEPSAQSLTFLASDIKDTKQDLRELGRQPLTAAANVTVINSAMAAGKAKSAVGAWAIGLKDALENAMKITALWLKLDGQEPDVNVYTEFDNFLDGDGGLEHLRSLRDNGDLSQKTLHAETKRRGVLSAEFDHDEELKNILAEVPGDEFSEDDDGIEDDPQNPNEPQLPGIG